LRAHSSQLGSPQDFPESELRAFLEIPGSWRTLSIWRLQKCLEFELREILECPGTLGGFALEEVSEMEGWKEGRMEGWNDGMME